MTNDDIITALQNAVNHGESLESAMQSLINSGYNVNEVREASSFIGKGALPSMQPEEELTMPSQKKGFFSKFSKLNPFKHFESALLLILIGFFKITFAVIKEYKKPNIHPTKYKLKTIPAKFTSFWKLLEGKT